MCSDTNAVNGVITASEKINFNLKMMHCSFSEVYEQSRQSVCFLSDDVIL